MKKHYPAHCRGVALLITLLIISMLTLLGSSMTHQSWINLLATRNLQISQQNRQSIRKLINRAIDFIKKDIRDVNSFNWSNHRGVYSERTVFKKSRQPRKWKAGDYVHTGNQSGYSIEYLGTVNFVNYRHGKGDAKTSQVQVFRITAISYGKHNSSFAAQVVYSRIDPMASDKKDKHLPTGVRSWTDL